MNLKSEQIIEKYTLWDGVLYYLGLMYIHIKVEHGWRKNPNRHIL